jgi:hypothetical protein
MLLIYRCCQTNANQSPLFANEQVLGDEKVAPLAKRGFSHRLEPGLSIDLSLMVEVVAHR